VDKQYSSPSLVPGARKSERLLLLLFLLSLPFLNPWVRGDGVGYYAFARAPLIQHNLDFTEDYRHANESFRGPRLDENGQPRQEFRTSTGHLDNHFTVGPAILWTPFLLVTHAGVKLAHALGSSIAADGFSAPYRLTMALATAFYGFLGLLLAFRLARQYVHERWALLATIAIWWASSLPIYMYFNPSWSHAHSAFAVALFLWYWHETRFSRTFWQWLLLGLVAGLMLDVYYANAMVLVVLVVEAARDYLDALRGTPAGGSGSSFHETPRLVDLLLCHVTFLAVVFLCLLPIFLTRLRIYGNAFASGYTPLRDWLWRSPAFLEVLFASNHGLLAWTPILLFALIGLILFWWRKPHVGLPLLASFLAYYLFIACYPDWAGISSYGNRFFVSLTALFILGLSVFLDRLAQLFRSSRAMLAASTAFLAVFILWNVGLMIQWGSHLIPARGPISFQQMIRNQFLVVPQQITRQLDTYLFRRKAMMQQIEQQDVDQLKQNPPSP
jgi:hypothetical protein